MKENKDGSVRRSKSQNTVVVSGGLVEIDGATIQYDEKKQSWLLNGTVPGIKGNFSNLSQALRKVVTSKNKTGLNDTTYSLGILLQNNGYVFQTPFVLKNDNSSKNTTDFSYAEEIPENTSYNEGSKQTITINKYERDPAARRECLKIKGYSCSVCKFNFKKFYGEIGENYIHVHHLIPLKDIGKNYIVDPRKDLLPVCPNCHAMLHKCDDPGDLQHLKSLIKKSNDGR